MAIHFYFRSADADIILGRSKCLDQDEAIEFYFRSADADVILGLSKCLDQDASIILTNNTKIYLTNMFKQI